MPVSKAFALAAVWYAERMAEDWRPRSIEDARHVFTSVGLIGDFWHR